MNSRSESTDELKEVEKVLQAIKKGAKPPPCRGKRECDRYCMAPENIEACLSFAEAADLIPKDELEEAKKFLSVIKKGIKPPECRGKAECEVYCSEPENLEECLQFAEAAGFVSARDAEVKRKTGGKGPGGCRGRECEDFCNKPENQETCFKFALEHDILREEDKARLEEGISQMRKALEGAPPEVISCISEAIGAETVQKIQAGQPAFVSPQSGDIFRQCFEQFFSIGAERGPVGPAEPGFEAPEDFEGREEFDELEEGGEIPQGAFSSAQDILKLLPPGIPAPVLECVKSQLKPEVIKSGEAGVRNLVEQCVQKVQQGGNIFQIAKRFLLRLLGR